MFDPKCFPEPVLLPDDETVDDFHFDHLTVNRMWVPGGWLMLSSLVGPSKDGSSPSVAIASTFVSDPDREWPGDDLPEEVR